MLLPVLRCCGVGVFVGFGSSFLVLPSLVDCCLETMNVLLVAGFEAAGVTRPYKSTFSGWASTNSQLFATSGRSEDQFVERAVKPYVDKMKAPWDTAKILVEVVGCGECTPYQARRAAAPVSHTDDNVAIWRFFNSYSCHVEARTVG